jgi:arylsulfatase A-like enzyme
MDAFCRSPRVRPISLALASALLIAACGRSPKPVVLTADMPLHLEDHLDTARIEGSELPTTSPAPVEWRFSDPQPDWKPALSGVVKAAQVERVQDALRVTLTEGSRNPNGSLTGGIYIDLPDWRREEWSSVIVRARTTSVTNMNLGLNPREGTVPSNATQLTFQINGGSTPIVSDGSVQTHQIRPNWGNARTGPWRRVGFDFRASEPGSIDILSVSVVPTAATYAGERTGLRSVDVAGAYRRSLFTHAPGRVEYQVRVPEDGQLHAALGLLHFDAPVEFTVDARPTNGDATTVFHETYADPQQWADRTVDLSSFAGQTITLGLDTKASVTGTVAFWGSPTLSGSRRADKPNVILYIIDGGGADYMSVYEYNRRTTPNLEQLAAEGAVFEHAYSTATWTKPSTTSFMTSLHNSVLGNTKGSTTGGGRFEPLPEQAVTMAERFHAGGYQTGVFTSNPWAASASSLERGVDVMRSTQVKTNQASSLELQQDFWHWRETSPGRPYWVHFQTTDVHVDSGNSRSIPPFAGLFVSPEEARTSALWRERLREEGGRGIYSEAYGKTGINRIAFFTLLQGLYDESMAHNDYQLGRLVQQLKASSEWSNTLLIVAADHSIESAIDDMALAVLDPLPPRWSHSSEGGPLFRPSLTRVPLIVVWPGHIAGGQRFNQAVSLIDLFPTVLDLAGLRGLDVTQGQSLAPLLRGGAGWRPRPVVLEEVDIDRATGQLHGRLDVVDGRWAASQWIGPPPAPPREPRPWPLMVYDLWNDPICVQPINEHRPDLVAKYTKALEGQWTAHQALAKQFTPGAKIALTPEQLQRLRALGYIR